MAVSMENRLVVGISTRALFDLNTENHIFETQGVEAYSAYQKEHEDEILAPGPGFALVKALLGLNKRQGHEHTVEVIVMSKNSPDISLRFFHSIEHYGLDITRAVFLSGGSLAPYLNAFGTNLFLSADEEDVQAAIDAGIAAGIICENVPRITGGRCEDMIRIAFDGDAVLFSDEAERVYKEQGLKAFEDSEKAKALLPLHAGPFLGFLRRLSDIQKSFSPEECPIRTALVTARSAPAHERVIRTLRSWNVRIDEAFFLGGISKREVLSAFGAQIFFDDQLVHLEPASEVVPAARVPLKRRDNGDGNILRMDRKRDEVS